MNSQFDTIPLPHRNIQIPLSLLQHFLLVNQKDNNSLVVHCYTWLIYKILHLDMSLLQNTSNNLNNQKILFYQHLEIFDIIFRDKGSKGFAPTLTTPPIFSTKLLIFIFITPSVIILSNFRYFCSSR